MSFARYIARSAFFISVSASSPSCGNRLAPMLQPTYSSVPSSHTGSEIDARTRSIHAINDCSSTISVMTITNSSPPWRATVSLARAQRESRSATTLSKRSPTLCPRLSLTFLKPSRSMNTTATPLCWRLRYDQRMLQTVAQQIAVRQPGEAVVVRLILELLLIADQIGDVVDDADVMRRLAIRIRHRRDEELIPEQRAVLAVVAQHRAHLAIGGQRLPDQGNRLPDRGRRVATDGSPDRSPRPRRSR